MTDVVLVGDGLTAFAVTLGGEDGRTLFVCAGPTIGDGDPRTEHRGLILATRVGTCRPCRTRTSRSRRGRARTGRRRRRGRPRRRPRPRSDRRPLPRRDAGSASGSRCVRTSRATPARAANAPGVGGRGVEAGEGMAGRGGAGVHEQQVGIARERDELVARGRVARDRHDGAVVLGAHAVGLDRRVVDATERQAAAADVDRRAVADLVDDDVVPPRGIPPQRAPPRRPARRTAPAASCAADRRCRPVPTPRAAGGRGPTSPRRTRAGPGRGPSAGGCRTTRVTDAASTPASTRRRIVPSPQSTSTCSPPIVQQRRGLGSERVRTR